MIVALMIGRSGSRMKGKNIRKILGRPMCSYPLIACKKTKMVDKIFVSTDCEKIKKISKKYNSIIIDRPKQLATKKALSEDAFVHGYNYIKKYLGNKHDKIRYVILLYANSPTVNKDLIIKGIKILDKNKFFDSAVSTSIYNMWSPLRARRLKKDGTLKPFVPFEVFGDPKTLNCDRDSQGDVYYADAGVAIVRPKCLEKVNSGLLPFKFMGKKIAPIKSWGGCDVDYEWQIPQVEYWIKKNFK